jgi:CBS domain-containing protein
LGTLTDRDIAVRVCAENRPADGTRVGDVMTGKVVACRPTDDLQQAQRLMSQLQKSPIIVTR